MADARTARELADECKRLVVEFARAIYENANKQVQTSFDHYDQHHARMGLHAAIDRLRDLAALASQAEPKTDDIVLPELPEYTKFGEYYNGHDILGFEGEQLEEFARAAVIADRQRRTRPAPAQAEPTMADAIAAGDGTLHGAIDYWQQRALKAEQSEDGRDAARWRELLRQHEIDDDQATHNNYGRTYPKRTLCVFQDDGEDGLEPVPCDPGELTRVVDAAIAAKEQS